MSSSTVLVRLYTEFIMYGYLCFLIFLPLIRGNFLVQPLDVTSVVGEVVILRCTINRTDPASTLFYWSKDNNHLSVNNNIVESLDRGVRSRLSVVGNRPLGEYNLRIENSRRTDAGSYICSYIGISGGQTSRPAVLTVLIPPREEFPLCFVLAQSLRSTQGDGFWPGQTARLRCVSVGGMPPATLVWKRKNATISSTKISESIHERVLTPSDNGIAFTCQATSPALRAPKTCEVIPLRILPTVHIRLMTREVIQGSNATYHCEATAIPKVSTISWFYARAEVRGNHTDSERILISEDKQFITITDVRADEDQVAIECFVSTPTGLQSSDTMKMLVTRKQADSTKGITLHPGGRSPGNSIVFPWSSELHVIIIMVVGSLVGVLIFIFAILVCWGFARAKKPRRANTRLQVDHVAPTNQELVLEPLTYPSQIVYNTLPDMDTPPRRRELHHTGSFDEHSTGYLQSLYATVDRRSSGSQFPRFGTLPTRPIHQEKPVAQINPTSSPKRYHVIPYVSQHSSQPLIEDKDSYKGSSSRDSASSADETEIF